MYYNDELYHYGVKGMKWGVRRAQRKENKLQKKALEARTYRKSKVTNKIIAGTVRSGMIVAAKILATTGLTTMAVATGNPAMLIGVKSIEGMVNSASLVGHISNLAYTSLSTVNNAVKTYEHNKIVDRILESERT